VHKATSVMNFGNVESNEDHTENQGRQNEVPKKVYGRCRGRVVSWL